MGLVGASFEEDRAFWQGVGYLTAGSGSQACQEGIE